MVECLKFLDADCIWQTHPPELQTAATANASLRIDIVSHGDLLRDEATELHKPFFGPVMPVS